MPEGLLSKVEGNQSAAFRTDIECSVIFDGGAQNAQIGVQDGGGIVKVEQVAVRIVLINSTGIGSDPDGLHPVEEYAVHRMMAQTALCSVFVRSDAARHRINDIQSVESTYPHFSCRRFFDATDIVVGQSVGGIVIYHFR